MVRMYSNMMAERAPTLTAKRTLPGFVDIGVWQQQNLSETIAVCPLIF
jgi:hypothetical protein